MITIRSGKVLIKTAQTQVPATVKRSQFAPGIPNKKNYGEPTKGLTQDQDADYVLQHHQTMRNPDNPHYDLRLGSPETGMFSWAVPGAKLPEEGKRNLAVQTHVHEHGYNQFTGKIGKGYGAGIVTRADLGKAKITKISPNSIHFTVNTSKSPTNYSLVRIGTGKDARDWLLIRKKPKPEEEALPTKEGQVTPYKLPPIDVADYDALYGTFDKGHTFDGHVQGVRDTAKTLAAKYDPENVELADLAARLHDVGISKGREDHELHGHKMLAADPRFKVLPPDKRKLLLEAIRQHRATTGNPKSTFAKIIADADRSSQDTSGGALDRAYQYSKANYTHLTDNEHILRALLHLQSKFGPKGYGRKAHFPETSKMYANIYDPLNDLAENADIEGARKLLPPAVTVKAGQVSLLPWIPPLAAIMAGDAVHRNSNVVADKVMAQSHPSLLPPSPPIGITGILTIKQLRAYANKYIDDPYIRDRVMESGESMLKHKNNAAFMIPEGKTKIKPGAVIASSGMPKDTFKHEYGHAIDYMTQLIRNGKVNMGGRLSSALLAPFLGAKHTPLYKTEERAWDYSGVPKGDPVRESMLGTYAAGLKGPEWLGRYGIPGGLAANYAVKNPDKMHRVMTLLKGLIKRGAAHPTPPAGNAVGNAAGGTISANSNSAAKPGTKLQTDTNDTLTPAPAAPVQESTNDISNRQVANVQPEQSLKVDKDMRIGKWSSVQSDDTVLMRFIDKAGNVKARVHTEVADTPEKRRMGMSKRAFFPPGYGMFFDKAGAYWMKDVEFPIDILFLDKQGTVLEKQHMPADSEDTLIRPLYVPSSKEAEHALELPAGWFDTNGLAVGDVVVVKDPGHA